MWFIYINEKGKSFFYPDFPLNFMEASTEQVIYIFIYTVTAWPCLPLYIRTSNGFLSFFLMVIKSSSWKLGLCSHSDSQRFLKYKVPGCATKFGLEIKWFPRCSDVNILQIINTKQDNQVYVPCMFIFFFFILKRFVIR